MKAFQAPLQMLLFSIGIIIILLFATGVIRYEKTTYQCIDGRKLSFEPKVQLLNIGAFKIYGYPVKYDCATDEQYDPADLYKCDDKWCLKSDDTTDDTR